MAGAFCGQGTVLKYGDVWDKLGKQLSAAQNTVSAAGTRTRVLEKTLRDVQTSEFRPGRRTDRVASRILETSAAQDYAWRSKSASSKGAAMSKYLISFPSPATKFPESDLEAVAHAAHEVLGEAKAAGGWIRRRH